MAKGRNAGHGLKCPNCGSAKLFVTDTRSMPDYIRRRRKCEKCRYIATAYEVIEKVGDPPGTRISDVMQLRDHMLALTPGARVAVRLLLTRLAVESPKGPTMPDVPDDIPS